MTRWIAICCALSLGLAPYRATCCSLGGGARACGGCSKKVAAAKPAKSSCCKQGCRMARRQAPATPQPTDERRRCASCQCCPAKEPMAPAPPPPVVRPAASPSQPLDVAVVEADSMPQLTRGPGGHDPPAIGRSINERLARSAVWLK